MAYTRKPDGTALEPEFLENFQSLQTTGRPQNLITLTNAVESRSGPFRGGF